MCCFLSKHTTSYEIHISDWSSDLCSSDLGTVLKAIDELSSENLLLRRQVKGTFVATHHEAKVRFRFLRLTPDDGKQPVSGSQILDCRRVKAPVDIARLLDLRAADMVVNLRRLLSFDQVPTILDDIWLPGSAFRGLTADSLSRYREIGRAHV